MGAEIILKCKSCEHTIRADHLWAEHIEPGATYPSSSSIYSFLMSIRSQLKCSHCGSKELQILFEPPLDKKSSSISDHYKRYIDEGLAGTREGHKRMRSQQWSEMIRRHKE